jgi:hypothetical protein
MSRPQVLILALPATLTASLGAHSLAYRLVGGDGSRHRTLLEHSGHGYLSFAPLFLAFASALVLVGLALRVAAAQRGDRRPLRLPWLVALVPPLVFVVQEHLERLLQSGELPISAALEPTFAVGLSLQLPLAVLALLVARALVAAAEAVGRNLARRPRRLRRRAPAAVAPAVPQQLRPSVLALRRAGRAPPPALSA